MHQSELEALTKRTCEKWKENPKIPFPEDFLTSEPFDQKPTIVIGEHAAEFDLKKLYDSIHRNVTNGQTAKESRLIYEFRKDGQTFTYVESLAKHLNYLNITWNPRSQKKKIMYIFYKEKWVSLICIQPLISKYITDKINKTMPSSSKKRATELDEGTPYPCAKKSLNRVDKCVQTSPDPLDTSTLGNSPMDLPFQGQAWQDWINNEAEQLSKKLPTHKDTQIEPNWEILGHTYENDNVSTHISSHQSGFPSGFPSGDGLPPLNWNSPTAFDFGDLVLNKMFGV